MRFEQADTRILEFLLPLLGKEQADKYSALLQSQEIDWAAFILLKENHLKDLGLPPLRALDHTQLFVRG